MRFSIYSHSFCVRLFVCVCVFGAVHKMQRWWFEGVTLTTTNKDLKRNQICNCKHLFIMDNFFNDFLCMHIHAQAHINSLISVHIMHLNCTTITTAAAAAKHFYALDFNWNEINLNANWPSFSRVFVKEKENTEVSEVQLNNPRKTNKSKRQHRLIERERERRMQKLKTHWLDWPSDRKKTLYIRSVD